MIIRQAAFTGENKKLLKGGLHCHTTRSDGKTTPEETIRQHAENGYDFLAITDHRNYNFKNFAPETDVLIMPGMEMDGLITSDDGMCFHVVSVGREEGVNGYAQDEKFQSHPAAHQEDFQCVVDDMIKNSNLAIYCHPDWSYTPARSFEKIKGFTAMEIWNSGCVIEDGLDEDNGLIWDELLRGGQHIYAVATDDGHEKHQHCHGWVRVNAEKKISSVFEALKNGAFYSSTGPEIYDFYMEDGTAHIKCSPVKWIKFHVGTRPLRLQKNENGLITEASIKIPDTAAFVRVTVEDEKGMRAWTNPFFMR